MFSLYVSSLHYTYYALCLQSSCLLPLLLPSASVTGHYLHNIIKLVLICQHQHANIHDSEKKMTKNAKVCERSRWYGGRWLVVVKSVDFGVLGCWFDLVLVMMVVVVV